MYTLVASVVYMYIILLVLGLRVHLTGECDVHVQVTGESDLYVHQTNECGKHVDLTCDVHLTGCFWFTVTPYWLV